MSGLHVMLEVMRKIVDAHDGEALIDAVTRVAVERDSARAALKKISAIRDSIIGAQSVNWSAHVYPLVVALAEAGFEGLGFVEARKQVEEEIERRKHSVHLTPPQLAALLKEIDEWSDVGKEKESYGHFHGGDPRDFTPSEDASDEERAAWRADCERWNSAPQTPEPGPHRPIVDANGQHVGHLTLAGYGLGVNVIRPKKEVVDALAALRAAHERNEREGNNK